MPMRRRTLAALCLSPGLPAFECPDLRTVPADLEVPLMIDGPPGGRYPVLGEYAGNGNYVNAYGDRSAGTGDGVSLGYGVAGGLYLGESPLCRSGQRRERHHLVG